MKDFEVVYFSYPYTSNPDKNTKEIIRLVRRMIKKHPNIIPFIPHTNFDMIWEDKEGYSEERQYIGVWEFEIITRCDRLCYVGGEVSTGVFWEKSFAIREKIPIIEYEDLYNEE